MTATREPADPPARRPYRSPRREQQAAETRDAVLTAATRLFAERGWSGTGMRDVAKEAGVAVETVYANFGSKGDLLMAANDAAVVGDTLEVPLAERPEFTALAEGDLVSRVRAAARLNTGVNRRTAGLRRALAQAASADALLAARLRDNEERRRISVHQGADAVAGQALSDRDRDGLWAVLGVEVYLLLTELSGWSDEQYETWLTDTILRLLGETPVRHSFDEQGRRR